MAFDCFGAGQKVSQVSFSGKDWRKAPESAKLIFDVFLIMRQLHEILWYLKEAREVQTDQCIQKEISSVYREIENQTCISPESLMKLDVAVLREKANTLLLKTSEHVRSEVCLRRQKQDGRWKTPGPRACLIGADLRKAGLRGANLRGACLIAADLRGNDLHGTDFIGADFRDADLRGADLSACLFLTQAQINAAKGDANTKLPASLSRPIHWEV
jgi:hypothetical protein